MIESDSHRLSRASDFDSGDVGVTYAPPQALHDALLLGDPLTSCALSSAPHTTAAAAAASPRNEFNADKIMDENLSRGYVHFSRRHRGSERDHDAPHDNYNLVYLGLVLAGIGFLVPYNSFIIACDYFAVRLRGIHRRVCV